MLKDAKEQHWRGQNYLTAAKPAFETMISPRVNDTTFLQPAKEQARTTAANSFPTRTLQPGTETGRTENTTGVPRMVPN
jgi:hypothetical protein